MMWRFLKYAFQWNHSFSSWEKQLGSPSELINLEPETTTEKCIFQVEPSHQVTSWRHDIFWRYKTLNNAITRKQVSSLYHWHSFFATSCRSDQPASTRPRTSWSHLRGISIGFKGGLRVTHGDMSKKNVLWIVKKKHENTKMSLWNCDVDGVASLSDESYTTLLLNLLPSLNGKLNSIWILALCWSLANVWKDSWT